VPLTPLVDVVFILLVFFMLASSFLDWRVRPVAVAGPAAGSVSEGAVLVDLGAVDVRLSGEAMGLEAVGPRLAALLADRPGTRVLVRPAEGVTMDRTVALLDRLAAAGIVGAALAGRP